eukprot:748428-Hanusia_phi.AAC.4
MISHPMFQHRLPTPWERGFEGEVGQGRACCHDTGADYMSLYSQESPSIQLEHRIITIRILPPTLQHLHLDRVKNPRGSIFSLRFLSIAAMKTKCLPVRSRTSLPQFDDWDPKG